MPTIVRPEGAAKPKRKPGRPKLEPGPVKAQPASTADETERTLWNLRQQIAGCLQKIDELETMVYKLAYGGKDKEYYSVEEAAEIWGCSKGHVYLMIRDGRLPAVRIGENVVRITKATILRGTN